MELIRECDIRDVYDVYHHIKKYCEMPNLLMVVRETLMSSEYSVFKEGGICVILQHIDLSTVQLHIYVDPEFTEVKSASLFFKGFVIKLRLTSVSLDHPQKQSISTDS